MLKPIVINSSQLMDLWKVAVEACRGVSRVHNLVLNGEFPMSETSTWVEDFKPKAHQFKEAVCPKNLELNHGQFVEKYATKHNKTGIQYICEELTRKTNSNRACWSLIDMDLLTNSGDEPIPSFMLLQAGITDDKDKILMTCYFRALEVSKFLPINIAEACLAIEDIFTRCHSIATKFELTIHAGNAYYIENFSCLEKAPIDTLDPEEISMEIAIEDGKPWIKEQLTRKMELVESRINLSGMKNLIRVLRLFNQKEKMNRRIENYSETLINGLENVLKRMEYYNQIRLSSSYAKGAHTEYEFIRKDLKALIKQM
jgi:hypothetical protein